MNDKKKQLMTVGTRRLLIVCGTILFVLLLLMLAFDNIHVDDVIRVIDAIRGNNG